MLWNMRLPRRKAGKIFILIFVIFIISLFFNKLIAYSQADSQAPTPDYEQLKIETENRIAALEKQASTYESQISIMENQVKLTEYKIEATKQQIMDLTLDIDTATKKISTLQKSLDTITEVLLNRIVATYEIGRIQPLEILLSSTDASNFLERLDYLRIVQDHDKKLVYDVVQAKNDYANQKNIYESEEKQVEALKIQLQAYTVQLAQQKQATQELLNVTEAQIDQAKAQLAAFSSFTTANGGASILSNQTVCDDGWSGCYYNQRDNQWGTLALNNTQYSIAGDGCLMTSMAMVYTHYGHRSVTPISINSNSNNFASYFPAYLKYTITADGATSNRVGAVIDGTLSSGDPVVVGISYDGGPIPDHFVVLISGSGGNYKMNDPFVPNGHNISFTDHYSVGSIREIDKVNF
jgi:peptidoglycan hydrolase CwlO-like protein